MPNGFLKADGDEIGERARSNDAELARHAEDRGVGAPTRRLVDDGREFLVRILRRSQRIARRNHASRYEYRQMIDALPQLLAGGRLDLAPLSYARLLADAPLREFNII